MYFPLIFPNHMCSKKTLTYLLTILVQAAFNPENKKKLECPEISVLLKSGLKGRPKSETPVRSFQVLRRISKEMNQLDKLRLKPYFALSVRWTCSLWLRGLASAGARILTRHGYRMRLLAWHGLAGPRKTSITGISQDSRVMAYHWAQSSPQEYKRWATLTQLKRDRKFHSHSALPAAACDAPTLCTLNARFFVFE